MSEQTEPVVLDLAPLPRDKIGPFLILGLEKDASKEQMEANWARRLIWSRKNQIRVPLEDINWAKEIVADFERRTRADCCSLNMDVIDGVIRQITQRYGSGQTTARPRWRPLDVEKPVNCYAPAVEAPSWEQVRASITPPSIPEEAPAVKALLDQLLQQPLDPWSVELPGAGGT